MRRIFASAMAVLLALCFCVQSFAYSDYKSESFWAQAGEWYKVNVDGSCIISQANYKAIYYDETVTTDCCIAFQILIKDDGKYSNHSKQNVGLEILLKNAQGSVVDKLSSVASDGEKTIHGENGDFSFSWGSYTSTGKGIYKVYIIYNNLSSYAKRNPFSASVCLFDSEHNASTKSENCIIDFPRLSIESTTSAKDTTKTSKDKSSHTNADDKHSWASTTLANKSKTAKSGSYSSGKVKLNSTTAEDSANSDGYEQYDKADVITPQSTSNAKYSTAKIAAVCAGAVSIGCAVAIIASIIIKKYKNPIKISSEDENENK